MGLFDDTSTLVVTASYDYSCRVYQVESGVCIKIFTGHTDCLNSIEISSDCHYVLTSSDDKLAKMWDLKGSQSNSNAD